MNLTPIIGSDRRQYVRLPVRLKVNLELFSEEGKARKVPAVLSRDLSMGGLGLEISTTNATLWNKLKEKSTKIQLSFNLPGQKKSCRCLSRVMWKGKLKTEKKQQFLLGLSFLDLPTDAQRRLFQVIRSSLIDRLNKEYKKISRKKR